MIRTRKFALNVIRFVRSLPRDQVAMTIGNQLLRSGMSVGANYRAVCRAKSRPDFISKLSIVEEETDECCYWLDLLVESGTVSAAGPTALASEANELIRIVVASIRTARRNQMRGKA